MNRKDRNDFSRMFEDSSDLDITLSYPEQISDRVDLNTVSDKVHVKIKKVAKDFIDLYAASDTSKELGGVLIGSYEEINGQYHVCIEGAIQANYTDASKAEIKFTHQTWEDIDRKKDQFYPDKKIVGWFHTHPGFGVFLSDYDLFIQENFFKLAFQVAYVVDPVKGKGVFFGNGDGVIVKINYEIEETAMPAYRSRPAIRAYPKKRKVKKVFRITGIGIILLMMFITGIYFINFRNDQKSNGVSDQAPVTVTGTGNGSSKTGDSQAPEVEPFVPIEKSVLDTLTKDKLINEYKKLSDEYYKLKDQQPQTE